MTCCTLSWPEINSKLTRDVSFLHIINFNATIITWQHYYSKIVFQKAKIFIKVFQKVKLGFWWKGVQKSSDSWGLTLCFGIRPCHKWSCRICPQQAQESCEVVQRWQHWIRHFSAKTSSSENLEHQYLKCIIFLFTLRVCSTFAF